MQALRCRILRRAQPLVQFEPMLSSMRRSLPGISLLPV